VAEHVFALALAVSRNLLRADRCVREGRFAERDSLVGRELFGGTLGVIGLGRIGEEVARMGAAGFGMRVLGHDPYLDETAVRARGAEPVGSLEQLLPACDLVSVHVPLTEETRGLLGARELGLMRPGSVLVQAARGGVVDEGALVEALREGPLAGAGIDVFGEEPPPADHPLFSVETVVLSPHTAASTRQAMRRMGLDAARGILDILGGADALSPPAGAPWQTVNPSFADAGEREPQAQTLRDCREPGARSRRVPSRGTVRRRPQPQRDVPGCIASVTRPPHRRSRCPAPSRRASALKAWQFGKQFSTTLSAPTKCCGDLSCPVGSNRALAPFTGSFDTGSWIGTSGNTPSTHSGE
jgi:hypothetical protein